MSTPTALEDRPGYGWAAKGDVNAFFGLMLDNISGMILTTSLLVGAFGFPREFVLTRMIPGTAVGVLVGDLIFTAMAFRLARKTGRSNVTAMPLGLDTPSIFGTCLLIIGPAFLSARNRGLDPNEAAWFAWFVGIAMLLASGLFKLACAPFSGWVRRIVPRAGLLGSLSAIALVVISFLPLLKIVAHPVAGLTALAVILTSLTARWRLPGSIPGALGAVVLGCLVYYGFQGGMWLVTGQGGSAESAAMPSLAFRAALPMPIDAWWAWCQEFWREALRYLPIAIPLALATVVGGIDCTESASAAGDEYPTGQIIAAEGFATLVAGIFGGIIQTTPYIGHPAYKAMGGRAAYTLATALFVGFAGIVGYFDWFFYIIPEAAILPILIFIALEITAQSFHATPVKHYPALALACVPALAYLVKIPMEQVFLESGKPFTDFSLPAQQTMQTVIMLAGGGGFIITSLLWSTGLARLIDQRMRSAAITFTVAGAFALFGIIHSPLPESPVLLPQEAIRQLKAEGRYAASNLQTPYHWAAGYGLIALTVLVIGRFGRPPLVLDLPEGGDASVRRETSSHTP